MLIIFLTWEVGKTIFPKVNTMSITKQKEGEKTLKPFEDQKLDAEAMKQIKGGTGGGGGQGDEEEDGGIVSDDIILP